MKFSEVEQVMNDRFPGLTNVNVSRILWQAFSAVVTKRSTFVIGVRRRSSSTLSPFPQSSLVSTLSLSQAITHPLQLENTRLLEQENQQLKSLTQGDSVHPSTLEQELLLFSFMVLTTWKGLRSFHWIYCFLRLIHWPPTCFSFSTD